MNFDEFYEVFLEADAGKRKEYLEKKYNDKLHLFLTKMFRKEVYSDASEQFKISFGRSIIDFIIERMDPTDGVYSEWIIRTLLKPDFSSKSSSELFRFFSEDSYKVLDDLTKFHKYKRLFNRLAEDENNKNYSKLTDLNQIKSFTELFESIELLKDYIEEAEEQQSLKELEKDVDKVYNSENYLILIPKTKEASCVYGKNTRWCTAASNHNFFERYSKQGPLYIIIDKKKNEKYQFHFQSKQFMNEEDKQVDLKTFFSEHSEINEPIMELAIENKDLVFVSKYNRKYFLEEIKYFPEDVLVGIIKSTLSIALELAISHKDLVNKSQSLIEIEDEENLIIKTDFTEWSDLTNFIKGKWERETAGKILDGTYYSDYSESISDSELKFILNYVDDENTKIISRYLNQKYKVYSTTLDTIFSELRDKNDDTIEDIIRRSASRAYEDNYNAQLYEMAKDAVTKPISGTVLYKDDGIIIKMKLAKLKSLVQEIEEYNPENDQISCNWSDLYDGWTEILTAGNELSKPYYDNIYPDLIKSDFNELLKDELTTELSLTEGKIYLLSSINKGMTRFDSFISTFLEGLGNMGTGGMANRGPAVTKPSSTTSTTVNRPATTSSQNVNQNHSELDVGAYFKNQSTDWDREMKMPEFQNAVAAHFDKTMLDPKTTPQIKNELMTKIQKTPALQKYFQDRMNQQNQMGGIQ